MFPVMSAGNPITGYNINNSLRLRRSASAYLSRTPASAGNQTTWTYSAWIKRGQLGADQILITAGSTNNDMNCYITGSGDQIYWFNRASGTMNAIRQTTQVFRDPSAWYHIVLVWDTTNATASNRMRIYVNGVQITAFASSTDPSSSMSGQWNGTSTNRICSDITAGSNTFDGYITEVNFIDGQALTPSSFGATDATTGQWLPKQYSGTYGTNGFYLPFKLNSTSTYQANYTTTSQYLNVASNAAFGYGTGDFTIEGWHYATASGTSYLFDQRTSTSQVVPALYISGGSYTVYINGAISLTAGTVVTNQWVHWALVKSSGTTKLYINGISVGSFSDANNYITSPFIIGNVYTGTTYAWAGYLSNIRVVKGTAVYTTNFNPPSTPLTAISGTSLLTLQNSTIIDNSTNAFSITNNGSITTSTATPFVANIAGDASGNGNSWQPNNINYSTVGTTYDSMTDVPTLTSATVANYAVMNQLTNLAGLTVSNANLNVSVGNGSSWKSVVGTMALPSTGKWYWEVTVVTGTGSTQEIIGVANTVDNISASYSGSTANTYGYQSNGSKNNNASGSAYGASYTTGDVIGVAVDLDAGTIVFYKNNTSQGTAFTGLSSSYSYVPAISLLGTTSNFAANFGQRPFVYTPPTGFVALNTYNLPTPTIKKGNQYFDATTYTGTGSALTVTNTASFKPDFVWLKSRSNTYNNGLFDSIRGVNKVLVSNLTDQEQTETAGSLSSFNSNGFGLGGGSASYAGVNINGSTYVGWQWQAGQGTTSSNTSGSITSTVSVNTTAGFSIVTYTGTGANATVGHGLGVAPKFVIVKRRNSTGNWQCWHTSFTGTQYITLNLAGVVTTNSTVFNGTPTSTIFNIGTDTDVNISTSTYVAYCWAEIAGFSKFGSYTGNGSADGPFVYTGFRPKYIMRKCTSSASTRWIVLDTSRSSYNQANDYLAPNYSNAEDSTAAYWGTDILSNGFKLRNTDAESNASGGTYIYAAFAENPFKNANAR